MEPRVLCMWGKDSFHKCLKVISTILSWQQDLLRKLDGAACACIYSLRGTGGSAQCHQLYSNFYGQPGLWESLRKQNTYSAINWEISIGNRPLPSEYISQLSLELGVALRLLRQWKCHQKWQVHCLRLSRERTCLTPAWKVMLKISTPRWVSSPWEAGTR